MLRDLIGIFVEVSTTYFANFCFELAISVIIKDVSEEKRRMSQKSNLIKRLIPFILLLGIAVVVFFATRYYKKELFMVMDVPSFSLTDQHGKTITDKDMLGKVYVVEFFFSTCPTICPIMNRNIRHIDQEINNPNFGVISISIDPEKDTIDRLKKHADSLGIKNPNWHFLTGDRKYIGKIADEFDIYVGKEESGAESLNHSGMFALVDKKGKVRCRFDENNQPILYYSGLNYSDVKGETSKLDGKYHPDREKLIEDIQTLLKESN